MRILIYVLPVVILLSCESKEVVNNSVELDKEISNRYERLRYYDKVTNQLDFGPSHNINKIDSLFSLIGNLPENQENLKMLNNKLEQLESIYHINLLNIRSFQGSDLIVKMNKILILDAILNEKMQVALFKPRVELVKDSKYSSTYNVWLEANDSILSLRYHLLNSKGEFLLFVNDSGRAEFSFEKPSSDYQHNFKGIVEVMLTKDKKIKLPFESPSPK